MVEFEAFDGHEQEACRGSRHEQGVEVMEPPQPLIEGEQKKRDRHKNHDC